MIKVSPINGSYNQGFEITGHAGHAPSGEDIVCAGVTACAFTTCYALEGVAGQANVKSMFKSGHTRVEIITEIPSSKRVMVGFLKFMKQCQSRYPGRIEIVGGKQ